MKRSSFKKKIVYEIVISPNMNKLCVNYEQYICPTKRKIVNIVSMDPVLRRGYLKRVFVTCV